MMRRPVRFLWLVCLMALAFGLSACQEESVPKAALDKETASAVVAKAAAGLQAPEAPAPAEEAAAPVQRVELPAQPLPAQQPAQAVTHQQTHVKQPVSPAQGATDAPAKPLTAMQIFQIVWAGGSALLGLWLFGTWLVFMVQLHKSRRFLGRHGRTRIYFSRTVKSPCLAGLVPALYLT